MQPGGEGEIVEERSPSPLRDERLSQPPTVRTVVALAIDHSGA